MATYEPQTRQPLRLPAGSIRGIMSLLIAGLFWTLLLISEQKQIQIPLFLYFLSGMVFVFFVAHGKTIEREGQSPPLGLPRGALRFIILVGTLIVIGIYLYQHDHSPLHLLVPDARVLAEQWKRLTIALFAGFFAGWLVGNGPWRNSAIFQDVQAWISIVAMIGLTVEVMILLFINPNLQQEVQVDLKLFEAILTGIIAFYFGSRS